MNNNNHIIYDSIKNSKTFSANLVINDPTEIDRTTLFDFEPQRIVCRQYDDFSTFDACFKDQDKARSIFELIKETTNKKTMFSQIKLNAIITPIKEEQEKFIVFYLANNVSFISPYETNTKESIITFCIQDSFLSIDKKIFNIDKCEDFFKNLTELNDEENDFISKMTKEQNDVSWFNPELYKKKSFKEKKESTAEQPKKKKAKANVAMPGTPDKNSSDFVNLKSLKIIEGSCNPERDLENIIGMQNIKKDIIKLKRKLEYFEDRKNRGVQGDELSNMHMCFMGNPGTGKTTIARIMTGILYRMRYIKNNKCVEVNGLDLKGGYVGQTGIITKKIIEEAKGGILFIDEAYALCEDSKNSYGKEAISVLLKEMEDNRDNLVVIFAGYADDIDKFLNVNPGFRSRINKYFVFEDYTTTELGRIFVNQLRNLHLKIDEPVLKDCMLLFQEAKEYDNFSNGRFVRNLSEKLEEQHILNVVTSRDYSDTNMDAVVADDFTEKIRNDLLSGV